MPRFHQHLKINLVCLSVAEAILQFSEMAKNPEQRFDGLRFLRNVGLGVTAGALPDLIEPSLGNPNHRGFFHSLSAAGLVWWYASGEHNRDLSDSLKQALKAAALGYTCHLGADLLLSKGKGMGLLGPAFYIRIT